MTPKQIHKTLKLGFAPSVDAAESVARSHCFILCRQGNGNRMQFLFPLTLHLCRTGYNIFRLQAEHRHKASERISIEFYPLFFSYQEVNRLLAIKLTCVGGCASTPRENPFSDFIAKLMNASRYASSSVLAVGRRK